MKLKLKNSKSYSFLQKVKQTIILDDMFCLGDRVLVAVSGGIDSMVLLHVLVLLSLEFKINIGVAHLNHKLRGYDSEKDAIFVKSIANMFGVPFYGMSADVLKVKNGLKLSIEEAARKVRYAFFKKLMIDQSFSKVALAHHMEDNAELILMFMLRGAGLKGLSGISSIRENCFVRPLIRMRKYQIINFSTNEKIGYVEDVSNTNLKFTRNNIRHFLMPILVNSFNPNLVCNLNRMAVIISDEDKFLNHTADIEYKRAILVSEIGRIVFSIPIIIKLHIAMQRRLIRRALLFLLGSLKRITFAHVEAVTRLMKDSNGTKYICINNFIRVVKVYKRLKFKLETKRINTFKKRLPINFCINNILELPLVLKNNKYYFKFSILKPSQVFYQNSVNNEIVFLDLELLEFPINIRYVLNGDRFNPLGMIGNQKIKKYLSNRKVPLSQRDKKIVIDANGSIIWLVSHTICNYAKLTDKTKNVLMIEFCLLKKQ